MPRLSSVLAAGAAACASLMGTAAADGPGCRDMKGNPVDWFIAFKYPRATGETEVTKAGLGFAYMDTNTNLYDTKVSLNTDQHAIAKTLDQIYAVGQNKAADTDLAYLMYDDQAPPKDDGSTGKASTARAHMKGELLYSTKADQGFWFIHSVPRFPPNADQKYAFEEFAVDYAQSFLCLTMTGDSMKKALDQIHVAWPLVFDSANPSGNAQIKAIADGTHDSDAEDHTVELTTKGGHAFTSFYKNAQWNNALYKEMVVKKYNTPALTFTWQNGRGKEADDCPSVKNVNLMNVAGIQFKETQNHAKIAVADPAGPAQYVCIGGINRQSSQHHRGGGTVCTTDPRVYKAFAAMVVEVEPCSSSSESSAAPTSTSSAPSTDGDNKTALRSNKKEEVPADARKDDHKVASNHAGDNKAVVGGVVTGHKQDKKQQGDQLNPTAATF